MGSTEAADMLALIAAAPELATPVDTETFLDAMPVAEIASMWGAKRRPTSGSMICSAASGITAHLTS